MSTHNICFHGEIRKIYVVGTHKKCLSEALLMSTHHICFHREIRKILNAFDCKERLIWSYEKYSSDTELVCSLDYNTKLFSQWWFSISEI